MTNAVQFVNGIQNFLDRIGHPPPLGDWQPEFLEHRKDFGVKIDIHSFNSSGSVKHDSERAFSHDRWLELLQRAGRGVAGVCTLWQPFRLAFLVKFLAAA